MSDIFDKTLSKEMRLLRESLERLDDRLDRMVMLQKINRLKKIL